MTTNTARGLFDFGIARVVFHRPGTMPGNIWTWGICFRDGRIFHITRRSGALREWKVSL